jgi:hypothetical protein
MNQLVIAGVAAVILTGAGYGAGWRHAQNSRDAQELAVARGMEKAAEAALAVVQELPKKFIPIKGDVQREIHYETRYLSPSCEHSDTMWMHLQRAYEAAGGTWGDRGMSTPGTPAGQNPGGNDEGVGGRMGGAGEVSRSVGD